MNKKKLLFLIIVVLLIIVQVVKYKKSNKDVFIENISSEYSLFNRFNYIKNNKDYNDILEFKERDLLNELFLKDNHNFIMTSLLLMDKNETATKYAKKVLNNEYNDIALSILLFNKYYHNKDELEKYLKKYNNESSIFCKKVKRIINIKNKNLSKKDLDLWEISYLDKYNAMKLDIDLRPTEAKKLYNKSLDEKFLINTLLLLINLEIKGNEMNVAINKLSEFNSNNNSFIYDELINNLKQKKITNNNIKYKDIISEFMFDNSFINKDLEIILPYLSYKLSQSFDLALILQISNMDNQRLYKEAIYIINKNIDSIILKDVLKNQKIDILLKMNTKNKKILKSLKKLSNKYPSNLFNYIKISSIYEELGYRKKAIKVYDIALNKLSYNDRKNWIIYFNRGVLYDKDGNWDMAELDLKKALQLNPNNPALLNYLGYSWLTKNKNKEMAIKMIKASLNIDPFNSEFIDSLGWGLYLTGDYNSSLEYLEPAKMINNQSSIINYHLAVVYEQLKREREALYQYKKALRFNKFDDGLKEEEIILSEDKIKLLDM